MRASHRSPFHIIVARTIIIVVFQFERHRGKDARTQCRIFKIRPCGAGRVGVSSRSGNVTAGAVVGIRCRPVVASDGCHGNEFRHASRIAGHRISFIAGSENHQTSAYRVIPLQPGKISVRSNLGTRIAVGHIFLVGLNLAAIYSERALENAGAMVSRIFRSHSNHRSLSTFISREDLT